MKLLNKRYWLAAAIFLIYWFIPFDFIPDYIPLIGYIDEIVVGIIAILIARK